MPLSSALFFLVPCSSLYPTIIHPQNHIQSHSAKKISLFLSLRHDFISHITCDITPLRTVSHVCLWLYRLQHTKLCHMRVRTFQDTWPCSCHIQNCNITILYRIVLLFKVVYSWYICIYRPHYTYATNSRIITSKIHVSTLCVCIS